jgi:hypothetical protein
MDTLKSQNGFQAKYLFTSYPDFFIGHLQTENQNLIQTAEI